MRTFEKLLDAFPDTPRNIIVHADVLRRGIRMTEDLQDASGEACITGLTNKLMEAALGKVPIPSQFHFKADETTVDIKIDEKSPYEIKKDCEGKYRLLCGEHDLGVVRFTKRPSYMNKQTSDGKEVATMIMQRGPFCILVSPLDFSTAITVSACNSPATIPGLSGANTLNRQKKSDSPHRGRKGTLPRQGPTSAPKARLASS